MGRSRNNDDRNHFTGLNLLDDILKGRSKIKLDSEKKEKIADFLENCIKHPEVPSKIIHQSGAANIYTKGADLGIRISLRARSLAKVDGSIARLLKNDNSQKLHDIAVIRDIADLRNDLQKLDQLGLIQQNPTLSALYAQSQKCHETLLHLENKWQTSIQITVKEKHSVLLINGVKKSFQRTDAVMEFEQIFNSNNKPAPKL